MFEHDWDPSMSSFDNAIFGTERASQLRIIDASATATVRTVSLGQETPLADGAGDLELDNFGNLWIGSIEGIYMIPNTCTGLGPGYHAWSNIMWAPTALCHHTLCTIEAREATWAVLLTGQRCATLQHAAESAVGPSTRRRTKTLGTAVLPLELWLLILQLTLARELGAPA